MEKKNNLDPQYNNLLKDILENGIKRQTRNGEVLSVFGRQIRHSMLDGFPLLTTKKMACKTMVTELIWFLNGDTSIEYLLENDCNIWTGDAWRNYINEFRRTCPKCPEITKEEFINKIKTDKAFAKKWGSLGPIYGKQWRGWTSTRAVEFDEDTFVPIKYEDVRVNDQIQNLINDLKTNPDSRRLMVNAWNVGELDQMILPPCHYGFQVYTRELSEDERLKLWDTIFGFANEEQKNQFNADVHLDTHGIPKRAISLMWNQRSVDTFLGLPFNIASYGLLLEIIAKEVNMLPDELIGNLGDVHLYSNHIEQAKEQISREPFELPTLLGKDEYHYLMSTDISFSKKIEEFKPDFFKVENYKSHPAIKAPLSN
jgi:thymidylate synthase